MVLEYFLKRTQRGDKRMVQCSEKQSQASAGRAEYENGSKGNAWKRKNGICKDGAGSRRSQAGEQEESWESPVELNWVQRKRRHTEICMRVKMKH